MMILVVDNDKTIRLSLKLILERNGYMVALAEDPKAAIAVVKSQPEVELVLMDMNYTNSTTGDEGLTLLKQVKVFRPQLPVILMTAWGSIDLAVQGMRAGAFDFITKPWDNGVLLERIETAIKVNAESITHCPLPSPPEGGSPFERRASRNVRPPLGEDGREPPGLVSFCPPSLRSMPPSPASPLPMPPSSSPARAAPARNLLPKPFTARAAVPRDPS